VEVSAKVFPRAAPWVRKRDNKLGFSSFLIIALVDYGNYFMYIMLYKKVWMAKKRQFCQVHLENSEEKEHHN
jgi:hypothetical protein